MAFTRCIWCGKESGLTLLNRKEYSCNSCTFIHTPNQAKSAANMSDEDWHDHQEERKIRMKYPSFVNDEERGAKIDAELKAFREARKQK